MVKSYKKETSYAEHLQQAITVVQAREVHQNHMYCQVVIQGKTQWLKEKVVKHTTAYKDYMATLKDPEWVVEAILRPTFDGILKFVVKWQDYDETTNEPLELIQQTAAYEQYQKESLENPQVFVNRLLQLSESVKLFKANK